MARKRGCSFIAVTIYIFVKITYCLKHPPDGTKKEPHFEALVSSDQNYTTIKLPKMEFFLDDNTPIEEGKSENNGFLIAVFNQATGKPMLMPEHLQLYGDLEWLIRFLEKMQPGRIIIFVLRGDIAYRVPEGVIRYLEGKGSLSISFLRRGMTWSWAFINGGVTLFEVVSFPLDFKMAPTTTTDFRIILSPSSVTCPEWPAGNHWSLRRKFCDTYEKYGDLCWCQNYNTLNYTPRQINNSQIESAVITAIAHRAPMFYESLKTLLPIDGFNKSRLEVFTQKPQKELQGLLQLLDIPVTVTGIISDGVANTIMKQFVFAFIYVLNKYLEAEFFIFLEDDLRYSPDFFIFLNRTAELLRKDQTLYCASAHNDLGYPHTSYDPTAVLRTESFANYGWMVRRTFVKEMVFELQNVMKIEADWDIVTFHYIRGTRECIIPEISRSHHFGEGGYHVNQYQVYLYYAHKNYNLDPNALVKDVHLMEKNSYEAILTDLLNRSVPLDMTVYPPCSPSFYHALNSSEHSVITIFFDLIDLTHYRGTLSYFLLVECLDVYSTESREGHFGLFRMRWNDKHLLLVGYPASNYSSYKPDDYPIFNGTRELEMEVVQHISDRTPKNFFVLEDPADYFQSFLT